MTVLVAASLAPPARAGGRALSASADAAARELPERRTATSTTRRNADGSLTTTVHNGPIHYRAADGSLRPIDTTLYRAGLGGYAWHSGANSFEARFKDALEPAFAEVRAAGQAFRLTVQAAAASRAQVHGSVVTYPSAFPGTDLAYTVGATDIKEVLYLHRPDARTSYTFRLSTVDGGSGLSVRPRPDGSHWVMVAGRPDPVFVLPPPAVREPKPGGAESEPAPAARPALTVDRQGPDLVLTLSLDADWLRAPGRRFPVELDPTMVLDWNVDDGSFRSTGTAAAISDARLRIGGDTSVVWRAGLRFSLSGVPSDATVTDAKLALYYDRVCVAASVACGSAQHVLDAHRMTAWWHTVRSTPADLRFDPVVAGSYTLPAGAPVGWIRWPVTGTVQGWLSGAFANHGFLIQRRTEAVNSSGPMLPSDRFSTTTLRPRLELTYHQDGGRLLRPETLHANGAELAWTRYTGLTSGAPFTSYQVHRSVSPNFTPSDATRLATITDPAVTTYRDTTAAPDRSFTYLLLTNGSPSYRHTVLLPSSRQARKLLQPDPDAGRHTSLMYNDVFLACDDWGGEPSIYAGSETYGPYHGVLSFDLSGIPAGATVYGATASLWQEWGPYTATPTILAVHRIAGPWLEGSGWGDCTDDGATWYESEPGQMWITPGGDFDPEVVAQLLIPNDDGLRYWRDWTITSLVQTWVDGTAPNYGFLMKATDEGLITFHSAGFSSDDAVPDFRPRLTVTYADTG